MESSVADDVTSEAASTALWRNRDYMLLWGGQTVSLVGAGVSQTAFPLLAWDLTHTAAQVGMIGALGTLPYVLLSLFAGALIDRWDRKRVMIVCDVGRALNLVGLLLVLAFGHLTMIQLASTAVIEGTLFVFFNLAEVACLPRVVTREQLPAATAQNEATQGITTLISPLAGAALYGARQSLPFLADALSYLVSVGSLCCIKSTFQSARIGMPRRLHDEISEGLAWLWHQPLIRFMAFLTGGLNFTSAGLIPILLVLVKQQSASPLAFGSILTIAGVGSIIGSMISASIQRRFRFGSIIMTTLWIQALVWPLFAIAPNARIIGLIAAAIFVTGPVYNVVQFSYRLRLIPDELQGRVNSVFRLLAFGFQPVGWALTGILIEWIGVVPTIMSLFAVLLTLAILTTFNQSVRHANPILAARQS